MKKTLSFILAMLMVLSIFATVGMADGETEPTSEPEIVGTAAPAAGEPAPAAEEPAPATEEPAPATEEPIAPIAEQPADNGGVAPASEVPAPVSDPEPTEAGPAMRYIVLDCGSGTFEGYSMFSFGVVDGEQVKGLDWYAPERPGYKFTGWFDDKGTQYKDGDTIPAEVVELDAGWVRVVVLDAEPGNFTDGEKVDQNYTRTVELTAEGKLPDSVPEPVYDYKKTKEEQTVEFDGWYTGKCTFSETEVDGYWEVSIVNGGEKITDQVIEEGITTLYAGYKLKAEQPAAKVVTYYYDWNGIDGMYGHCLTSSRSYSETDNGYKLTPADLLIRYLNWNGENESSKNEQGELQPFKPTTQEELDAYWKDNVFNGYKFLGWSTNPKAAVQEDGTIQNAVKANETVIKNGESIYAVWTKDGTSNVEFDRTSTDVDPITTIRFPFGVSSSQSAHAGTTVNLPLDVAPAKGTGEIVWTLKVFNSTAIADVLLGKYAQFTIGPNGEETFDGIYDKNGDTGETAKLADYGITAEPAGRSLNISTNEQLTVVVSAAVEGHPEICTNFDVSISFSHNPGEWHQVQAPTCDTRGRETTECTVCHAVLARDILPLEHIWGYSVTKEATCTESGLEEKVCQRPGCEMHYSDFTAGQNLFTTIKPVVIAPTGHTYKITSTSTDEHGLRSFVEECEMCSASESGTFGDVDGNDAVNLADMFTIYRYVCGKQDTMPVQAAADVDGSESVNLADMFKVYRYICGKEPQL